ncbi:MAG: hypothetical protein KAT00_01645 [Planctomycetes bacterium]|nr:hypothetical protein [Planctomycetota bacterium]
MDGGYPAEANIDTFLNGMGIELVTENNPNFLEEYKQFVYGLLNAVRWATVLGVYCPSPTTFNVRGGEYQFDGVTKTYTTSTAIDPTDNDTTYIWMADDNTIGSAVDGTGWPAAEHIKLAEIDVDTEGVITEIRDLRGKVFAQRIATGLQLASIENAVKWAMVLGVYCPSPTTFNVRGGEYQFDGVAKTYTTSTAVDPTDNDTTYIWMADDNTIGSAVDGTGWPAAEHIKLAEIDVDSDGVITEVRDLRGKTFAQRIATGLQLASLENAVDWATALSVYRESPTTFNVRGGDYQFNGTVKTFTTPTAIDPTDNDTTYIWMADDNTIGSAVDGTGWPAAEHIKLAEIDADASGVITAIRDLRGKAFAQYIATGFELASLENAVDWATALGVYCPTPTTFNVRGGKYQFDGINKTFTTGSSTDPADDDTTYIWMASDNTIGSAVDGTGWPAADHIKLAEIDVDASGVITAIRDQRSMTFLQHRATGLQLANIDSINGGVPFILTATITAGATVAIHNANSPFKYRIIDAWSVNTSADGGTWKLTDGTNDITDTVTSAASDKDVDRASTIDDAYHEIAKAGSLSVVGDGATLDAIVYVNCIRVP